MVKRIAALTSDPYTVSLTDRECSLFIDPKSGSIFVDEGDGEGRVNGVVFSPGNGPTFSVRPSSGKNHRLVLDYRGIQFVVGDSDDGNRLKAWTESANSLLTAKGNSKQNTREVGESKPKARPHKNRNNYADSGTPKGALGGHANKTSSGSKADKEIGQRHARAKNSNRKRKGKPKK
jgi:hypothetical protein